MNSTVIKKTPKARETSLPTIVSTALASGATTLIVALAIGWLTIGRSAMGREEVIQLIATSAPYVRDRQALQFSINSNTQRVDEITQRLREIERQGIRVEAKLDLLLSEYSKREGQSTNDK